MSDWATERYNELLIDLTDVIAMCDRIKYNSVRRLTAQRYNPLTGKVWSHGPVSLVLGYHTISLTTLVPISV